MSKRQPPRGQTTRPQSQPTKATSQAIWQRLKDGFENPLTNFFISIIGLMSSFLIAVFPNPVFIRWLASACTILFLGLIAWLLRAWFTRKFFIGLTAGIIIGAILFPTVLAPTFYMLASVFAPPITVYSVEIGTDGELRSRTDGAKVVFSDKIPDIYQLMVNVEITPKVRINPTWLYDEYDGSDCCRKLLIGPDEYYLGSRFKEYPPNTTYYVTITAPFLQKPLYFQFNTGE